ncbi:MAG: TrmB family transcriptional regulator [bacterium]
MITLGLTPLQAKTYLTLLYQGPSDVKFLSNELGIDLKLTEKMLEELYTMGIIYNDIDNQKKLIAVSPEKMIERLRKEQFKRYKAYIKESNKVLALFKGVIKENKSHDGVTTLFGDQLFERMKALVSQSKREIYRVISGTGLITNYNNGIIQEELKASSRGVMVFVITDINMENVNIALKYSKNVELRHLSGSNFMTRFVTFDSRQAIVIASNPSLIQSEYIGLYIDNKHLVKALENSFRSFWEIAIPANQRISELINGT